MKTPIMTTNDIGNGSNREIVILMAILNARLEELLKRMVGHVQFIFLG
jgi:hypothetical protein